MKRFALMLLLILSLSGTNFGQFFLNGDAFQMSDSSCYQLTYEQNWSAGSIWNPDEINLNESFEVVLEVFLGCKDADGADGLVFGFQPVSTSIGTGGGDIGFGGVVPSLGIEIDTWQNIDKGDPVADHIAVLKNGNLTHGSSNNLAGPVQASATTSNIEDCNNHDFRVSWDAEALLLKIYFDCELRLSYTGDIVNNIFGGDPHVFWGFTSATGGSNNYHRVCLKYTTFLDKLQDVIMCPGGQVPFFVSEGVSYSWTPEEGLDNPFSPNPIASPSQTTLYAVEIRDACDNIIHDDVLVEVAGDSVFFDLGPDTLLCEGEVLNLNVTTPTATYEWSDGSHQPTFSVLEAGTYMVTVTRTDTFCISTDRVMVEYTTLPELDLGQDTILCLEQVLTLDVYDPLAQSYLWEDGNTGDAFQIDQTGTYSVKVTNYCGTVEDAINVSFENCREVYAPNVFSPNLDGINDFFMLMDGGDIKKIEHFAIFDRWGDLVFEQKNILSNDVSAAWDGEGWPEGVYTWFAEIEFRDGKSERLKGDVMLLR